MTNVFHLNVIQGCHKVGVFFIAKISDLMGPWMTFQGLLNFVKGLIVALKC